MDRVIAYVDGYNPHVSSSRDCEAVGRLAATKSNAVLRKTQREGQLESAGCFNPAP